MSKYSPLKSHLKSMGLKEIPITFEEIETVIGSRLPPSARKFRPWWNNNPSDSAIAHAWLAAGYKSAQVDLKRKSLTFIRDDSHSDSDASITPSETHPVFGCMRDTVTIPADTDLSQPAMPEWADMAQSAKLLNE